MSGIRTGAAVAALTMILTAGAAGAGSQAGQTRAADPVNALLGGTTAPAAGEQGKTDPQAGNTTGQDPSELRMTRALNDEILQRNQLAESQERADQAAFLAEREKYELSAARSRQERLAYEEALRQADAEQRRWAADRARWEADVRACQAGDRTRCAAPAPR